MEPAGVALHVFAGWVIIGFDDGEDG